MMIILFKYIFDLILVIMKQNQMATNYLNGNYKFF